jgi:arylsulfatase A-like enzyme
VRSPLLTISALLCLPVAVLLWPGARPAWAAPGARVARPNIVIITGEDLGARDVGHAGGAGRGLTPNIDRMARAGIIFRNAYAAAPVGAPTRAALLTGLHPARLGLTGASGVDGWPANSPLQPVPAPSALLPHHVTLAESLGGLGYRAAFLGRWDLGEGGAAPRQQGFGWGADFSGQLPGYLPPLWPPALGLEPRTGEHLTDRLTDEALRFIDDSGERPFLLVVSHPAPGLPVQPRADLATRVAARRPGSPAAAIAYGAMLAGLDESVGRIVERLSARRLSGRTLVIVTSGNGGLASALGSTAAPTTNAPLRGGKGHIHEGGLRIPLAIRWTGVIAANRWATAPVTVLDLHATLLALAGARPPPGVRSDGADLGPFLGGGPPPGRRNLCWHFPHYTPEGGRPAGAIRWGRYKLIEWYETGAVELHDLRRDEAERRDLSATMPEMASFLRARLRLCLSRLGATVPGPRREGLKL